MFLLWSEFGRDQEVVLFLTGIHHSHSVALSGVDVRVQQERTPVSAWEPGQLPAMPGQFLALRGHCSLSQQASLVCQFTEIKKLWLREELAVIGRKWYCDSRVNEAWVGAKRLNRGEGGYRG